MTRTSDYPAVLGLDPDEAQDDLAAYARSYQEFESDDFMCDEDTMIAEHLEQDWEKITEEEKRYLEKDHDMAEYARNYPQYKFNQIGEFLVQLRTFAKSASASGSFSAVVRHFGSESKLRSGFWLNKPHSFEADGNDSKYRYYDSTQNHDFARDILVLADTFEIESYEKRSSVTVEIFIDGKSCSGLWFVEPWFAFYKAEGRNINPQTAEIMTWPANYFDPYGMLPPFYSDFNWELFVRAPGSDVEVHFSDLPEETQRALQAIQDADHP
jgi:hypothetical protein